MKVQVQLTLVVVMMVMVMTCGHASAGKSTEKGIATLTVEDVDKRIAAATEGQKALIEELQARNADMEARQADMEREIQHLQAADDRHDDLFPQVAFSVASHVDFGPVTADSIIPFEIININIGNGWSGISNIFTAPLGGVYVFTTSMKAGSAANAYTHIVHSSLSGQTKLATLRGYNASYSGDANSVIVELEVGDVIYAQLQSSSTAYIDSHASYVHSTLSGFLLFE